MSDEHEHEQTTRSFRPGEWFGIFGEHASVILPPTEKSRVAALWEMVDDGAGFDETLDALIAGGLRDLPGFVLVSEAGGETRVVLRGAARASFTAADETVDLDGSVATTWVEHSLRGVTRMSVEVAEQAGSAPSGVEDLRLAGGLVRLSRVDQPPRTPAPADPVPAEPSAAEPVAEPPVVEPPPVDPLLPTQPPPSEPPPSEPPGVQWYADLEDEPTQAVPLLEGGPLEEQPAEEQPLVEEPVEDDVDPYYDEPPIWVPRPPAPPFGPPVLPPEPEVPGATTGPVARLVFSTGETVEVDRAVLVGRAPEAARSASGEEPRLVTVASPHQEISSTHLEIRPGAGADHGTAVITDLGSTNGTVLVQPGLPPEDLQPGIAVQLVPGAVVDLGDGVSIQVATP